MAEFTTTETPEISYLAKDYASFRRLMLDRLAALLPGGVEDQPADLQVALVELLAYTADRLSYYQDAVATEAYLGTARSRVSLRRHARLLDYQMHEGCNARVWIWCKVDAEVTVDDNWRFLTAGTTPLVFEPCRPADSDAQHDAQEGQKLYPQHNKIELVEGIPACYAKGATLRSKDKPLKLQRGDLLLFESTEQSVQPLRHVVRLTKVTEKAGTNDVEVMWDDGDSLPFTLPDTSLAVVRGNIVLADHGRSVKAYPLPVQAPYPTALWRYARLPEAPLTYAEQLPADFVAPPTTGPITSAAGLLERSPPTALPAITLYGVGEPRVPQRDLLDSTDTLGFVVETEHDGSAQLRLGNTPSTNESIPDSFTANYRIGNGRSGNIGPGTITRVEAGASGRAVPGVSVTNPLPAWGGEEPEPAEQVRLFAPHAFRTQERMITPADYAERAGRVEGVQRADAELRWTGSWYTVYLFIDPIHQEADTQRSTIPKLSEALKQRVGDALDPYRLAGYDLEICGPTNVPLDIALKVEIKPGFTANDVKARLQQALGNEKLPGDRRGFFHPDNWTFGQQVYLSKLYQAALAVPGVASVDATTFCRKGIANRGEARTRGVISIGLHEIASLNEPLPLDDRSQSDGREVGKR